MPPSTRLRTARPAVVFAIINCGWLLLLAALFAGYWNEYLIHPVFAPLNLARNLYGHDPIGGVVPAYVPWAGALGGVTISLIGCVRHSRQWDSKMNIWHALRPVLGAVSASVGFVILVLVLKAAAGTQFATDEIPTNAASQGLFFIIAFILGFREGLFLELIQKIAKMILTTGESGTQTSFQLNPDAIDFGPVPPEGASATVEVKLTEPENVEKITISSFTITEGSDWFSAGLLPANPSTPRSRAIVVRFLPRAVAEVTGKLEVVVDGMTGVVELAGSGLPPATAPQPTHLLAGADTNGKATNGEAANGKAAKGKAAKGKAAKKA